MIDFSQPWQLFFREDGLRPNSASVSTLVYPCCRYRRATYKKRKWARKPLTAENLSGVMKIRHESYPFAPFGLKAIGGFFSFWGIIPVLTERLIFKTKGTSRNEYAVVHNSPFQLLVIYRKRRYFNRRWSINSVERRHYYKQLCGRRQQKHGQKLRLKDTTTASRRWRDCLRTSVSLTSARSSLASSEPPITRGSRKRTGEGDVEIKLVSRSACGPCGLWVFVTPEDVQRCRFFSTGKLWNWYSTWCRPKA